MRVTFQLRFHTKYGQTLLLSGNHQILGRGKAEDAIPLEYLNDQIWQTTLTIPEESLPKTAITYNYILRNADGSLVKDWGRDKVINLSSSKADELVIIDAWNHAGYFENAFYTEPFKQVLLRPNFTEFRTPALPVVTHRFKVKAPLLAKGQTICILGDDSALANWNPNAPVLLNRVPGEDFLTVELDLREASFPINYKYGVYDLERKSFLRYEDGANRVVQDSICAQKLTIVNDGFASLPAMTWKASGVAIPVFSLRSQDSFGVGEFLDLKLLIDWCKQTALKLIQLLPINDTSATRTWSDSYPYAAISAFALHPLYLRLSGVVTEENRARLWDLEEQRKGLNALECVDYESVMRIKMECLRQIFPLQKLQTFEREDYRRFFEQNRHWLAPYAAFCYLRDKYGTADFNQWPAHGCYRSEDIAVVVAEGSAAYGEISFHFFIQYHLHRQLAEASEYAHANGVILKGDIPIGVYRYGADAWQEPDLYHLDQQAGAPPDAFAVKGQNWGFPTYNWPRMKADAFAWWRRRFEQMGHYFDAFRIDHILGFFRIWSIPARAVEGIMGHFLPAIPVHLDEFGRRGIRFQRERYTMPYINDVVLSEVFGPDSEFVKGCFLRTKGRGEYALKPEFATQRQVEDLFRLWERNPHNEKLKHGLFDLISNVILFEDEGAGGRQYHFRFGIENTWSFKHLDQHTQTGLKELYIDYFYQRQDEFWAQQALEKLPELKRTTNMLVCGEDLGLVPHCVPEVMRELGLLSLEVQRMPKHQGLQFFRPSEAPYLSVVTPSTHDMSTIRGWWKEDRRLSQRFYNQELGESGVAPAECLPWVNKAIVLQHLASPSMWSIFQLQDLLGMDELLRRSDPEAERINVPANPGNYWRYRMHLPLETLLLAADFNRELKIMVFQTGRA